MSYTTEPQLLTETEAAYVINCSVSALQKSRMQYSTKILDGLAPKFVKVGGKVRYRQTDIEQFVKRLTQQGNSEEHVATELNKRCREPGKPLSFDWSTLVAC